MSTAASVEPAKAAAPGSMSLTGHLTELRNRLIWSIIAIAAGTVVGFAFGPQIISVLKAPIPANIPLITTELGSAFSIRLQVAIVAGVILAMPVLLWHVWRFVAPGLTPSERRAILPWIPLALAFFGIGVSIAYVIMPFAAQFLFSFVTPDITPLVDIRSYFDFLTTLFLAFGILMEFPILLVGLSRVGIVTSARLIRSRRMIILIIAVFSAVATPGGDLVSPTVLGLTLYVLFEGTVVFIRRTGR
jgi:sec-independent protein translocase protein TatC